MIVLWDPKTFYFDSNWSKDVDGNLKHKTEFIIKRSESLAQNNYCSYWIIDISLNYKRLKQWNYLPAQKHH